MSVCVCARVLYSYCNPVPQHPATAIPDKTDPVDEDYGTKYRYPDIEMEFSLARRTSHFISFSPRPDIIITVEHHMWSVRTLLLCTSFACHLTVLFFVFVFNVFLYPAIAALIKRMTSLSDDNVSACFAPLSPAV